MSEQELLDTLWEVPDDLWEEIAPLIAELDPAKSTGRKRQDPRRMLNGIISRLRSGCRWNHLPRYLGDDSTIHRTFQRWEQVGLFSRIWERVQSRCEELGGVDWEWQSADGAMGKARLGRCHREEPHRPRKGGNQAQYPGGSRRRAVEHCGSWGQHS